MSYYYTTEPGNAVPGKSCANPKTHVPGSSVKERGHRYYSSEIGRWLSRDSEEEGGALFIEAVDRTPFGVDEDAVFEETIRGGRAQLQIVEALDAKTGKNRSRMLRARVLELEVERAKSLLSAFAVSGEQTTRNLVGQSEQDVSFANNDLVDHYSLLGGGPIGPYGGGPVGPVWPRKWHHYPSPRTPRPHHHSPPPLPPPPAPGPPSIGPGGLCCEITCTVICMVTVKIHLFCLGFCSAICAEEAL